MRAQMQSNDQLPRFGAHLNAARVPELLARAKEASARLASMREQLQLGMEPSELSALLVLYEEISTSLALAGTWAGVLFSVESSNEAYAALESSVSAIGTEIGEQILFFSLTLKTWPRVELERYAKALPRYAQWLRELGMHALHALSEEHEKLLLLKDEHGADIHDKVYEMLTSTYLFTLEYEGKTLSLTRGELTKYLRHKDRAVRKAAAEALIVPYTQHAGVLAELYRAIALDYDTETVRIRKYEQPIAARHLNNLIPADAFDALVASVAKHRSVFHRYIHLKQRALGYKDFTRYDFLAPIDGLPDGISWVETQSRVLDAFAQFAPWLHDAAKKVFDAQNIDAQPRIGKRSGAFCAGVAPGEVPFVLCNHTGNWDDVSTVAHELGHAAHDIVAAKNSILTFSPPLVLAETASTFAEHLLFMQTVQRSDARSAIALLCHKLDDALLTIVNQTRIVAFELEAHRLLAQGATAGELDALWSRLAAEDFPMVEWPESSVQWRTIPHIFHTPFYCYSYVFGLLLVFSLWKRYEQEGKAFTDSFHTLLAAGGNEMPADLLGRLGIDIQSQAFWDGGFSTVEGLVNELENRLKAYK